MVVAAVQPDLIGTLMGDHILEDQRLMVVVKVPMQIRLIQLIMERMESLTLVVAEAVVVPLTHQHHHRFPPR